MNTKKNNRPKIFIVGTDEYKAFEKFERSNFFENDLYYSLQTHSSLDNKILYNIIKQIFNAGYTASKPND